MTLQLLEYIYSLNHSFSLIATLGVLVIACLPLEPRFAASYPAKDSGFLRAIKIHSMTPFGGEVKLLSHVAHLWHVKEPYEYEETILRQNSAAIYSPFFSCFTTRWPLLKDFQRALVDKSGMIINCTRKQASHSLFRESVIIPADLWASC
jgi:hypothetical protein